MAQPKFLQLAEPAIVKLQHSCTVSLLSLWLFSWEVRVNRQITFSQNVIAEGTSGKASVLDSILDRSRRLEMRIVVTSAKYDVKMATNLKGIVGQICMSLASNQSLELLNLTLYGREHYSVYAVAITGRSSRCLPTHPMFERGKHQSL